MKIGVLNELLNDISCTVSARQETSGNLIKYEPVLIRWAVVRNMPFELSLTECS